jgi:hypothetical protein
MKLKPKKQRPCASECSICMSSRAADDRRRKDVVVDQENMRMIALPP